MNHKREWPQHTQGPVNCSSEANGQLGAWFCFSSKHDYATYALNRCGIWPFLSPDKWTTLSQIIRVLLALHYPIPWPACTPHFNTKLLWRVEIQSCHHSSTIFLMCLLLLASPWGVLVSWDGCMRHLAKQDRDIWLDQKHEEVEGRMWWESCGRTWWHWLPEQPVVHLGPYSTQKLVETHCIKWC